MGTYTGPMHMYVFLLPFLSGIFAKEEKKQQESQFFRQSIHMIRSLIHLWTAGTE